MVVEFEWEVDCRRFENEYVGMKEGMNERSEKVEGKTSTWYSEEGTCKRSYEPKRN